MGNPMREPVKKRDWILSAHAEERCAKRFKLIVDAGVRQLVSQELDSHRARILDIRKDWVRVYEISIMKTPMIAVCNTLSRYVVTFLQPERWHRHHPQQLRRRRHGRPLVEDAGDDAEE